MPTGRSLTGITFAATQGTSASIDILVITGTYSFEPVVAFIPFPTVTLNAWSSVPFDSRYSFRHTRFPPSPWTGGAIAGIIIGPANDTFNLGAGAGCSLRRDVVVRKNTDPGRPGERPETRFRFLKRTLPAGFMESNLEQLENLARLAKETTAEGRQQLLRKITDMFMVSPPDALNSTEVEYFGDVMGHLVFEMEMKVRQHLAETMSGVNAAPYELIKNLASDEIEVARPVLMKSGVLQDADLIEIVKQSSQEHLMAVSTREKVSEQVADALVEKGNDQVLGSLAGNDGAELSRNAMETMVARSEGGDEALNEALVMRDGMPADLMQKIYNHVSSALREHILSQGVDIDESQVDDMLAETGEWLTEEGGGEKSSEAEKYIQRKARLNQLDQALLLKLMREGRVQEFIAGIALLGKIDIPTARQTLFDKSGEKMAVVCKALEFDSNTFSQLVELSNTLGKRDESDKANLVGIYGRITKESAQRAMRFLRTRQKIKKDESSSLKKWGG